MKKLAVTIILFATSGILYGQNSKDLKGPKFKNRKPWKVEKTSILKSNTVPQTLKSYNAKNTEPWENRDDGVHKEVISVNRGNIKGPKAKNMKPWKLNER